VPVQLGLEAKCGEVLGSLESFEVPFLGGRERRMESGFVCRWKREFQHVDLTDNTNRIGSLELVVSACDPEACHPVEVGRGCVEPMQCQHGGREVVTSGYFHR
jgi:hypothetical protein